MVYMPASDLVPGGMETIWPEVLKPNSRLFKENLIWFLRTSFVVFLRKIIILK